MAIKARFPQDFLVRPATMDDFEFVLRLLTKSWRKVPTFMHGDDSRAADRRYLSISHFRFSPSQKE